MPFNLPFGSTASAGVALGVVNRLLPPQNLQAAQAAAVDWGDGTEATGLRH